MKSYTITVNGTAYDVTVEENNSNTVAAAAAAPAAAPKKTSGVAGAVKHTSPMPGKILAIKADAGTTVKRGQAVIILEAMKMENEIVAQQDGKIASVNVSVGESVEAGAVLFTMN